MVTRAHVKKVAKRFGEWVNEQEVVWIAVTFTCRKRPVKLKKSEAALVQMNQMSLRHVGSTCSKEAIRKAVAKTASHMDFKYVKSKLRKRGLKIRRVLFEGGDTSAGVWNHAHGLIELPRHTSLEDFSRYINKIFQSKLEEYYGALKRQVIESSVWCEPYEMNGEKYTTYCLRLEEGNDRRLSVDFDKMYGTQLVLSSPAI